MYMNLQDWGNLVIASIGFWNELKVGSTSTNSCSEAIQVGSERPGFTEARRGSILLAVFHVVKEQCGSVVQLNVEYSDLT